VFRYWDEKLINTRSQAKITIYPSTYTRSQAEITFYPST
jgi:hypothetical protein